MRCVPHVILLVFVFLAGIAASACFSIGARALFFPVGAMPQHDTIATRSPAESSTIRRVKIPDEEMLTRIMSAVAEDEPLLRSHRLFDTLGQLGAKEFAALFDRAVRLGDHDRRGALLAVLLNRWAALDRAAAAAAVRPYQDRFRASGQTDWRSVDRAVCEAWIEASPEQALAEAVAMTNILRGRDMARVALQSLAGDDLLRQLETLARLPTSRMREHLCLIAINGLAEKDPAAAEAHLNLFREPRERASLQAVILVRLTARDPAAGLDRLAALAPDLTSGIEASQLVSAVLGAAAKQDAAAALAAVGRLPEELQKVALGSALAGWAAEHPLDALTWAAGTGMDVSEAKAFTSFDEDGGVSADLLFHVAFESDRAQTIAWARAQPFSPARDWMLREALSTGTPEENFALYAELSPGGRAEAAERMVEALIRNGGEDISSWIKAQPAGAAREIAIESLAGNQARKRPERTDVLAESWASGPDRDAALRGIALSLSLNEPVRALDFAARVIGVATRESTFERIAQSWLSRDEPAARAWIGASTELSAEEKRVLLRQFDER